MVDYQKLDADFKADLAKADEHIHSVEKEWHYPILIKYGYEAQTKTQKGFSRTYAYVHPETQRVITVTNGINSDYWSDKLEGFSSMPWQKLEAHLISTKGK